MIDLSSQIDAFTKYFQEHLKPLQYEWPVPSSVQSKLSEFNWHKKSGSAEESIELKHFLTKKWLVASTVEREQLSKWIVADWGGVRRNSQDKIISYVKKASTGDLNLPLSGVASYSKIFSMADCTKYAIYDARVAACLNAIQLYTRCENPIYFPHLPSRNKLLSMSSSELNFVLIFCEEELVTKRGWRILPKDLTYSTYLKLLHDIKKSFTEVEIYHLEMVLFSQALILCPRLVDDYMSGLNEAIYESVLPNKEQEVPSKDQLIEVIISLKEVRRLVFSQIVNFGLATEYRHLNEAFEEGDIYNFWIDHFYGAKDPTLIKLVELCEEVETTVESIMSDNNIKGREVGFDDWDDDK